MSGKWRPFWWSVLGTFTCIAIPLIVLLGVYLVFGKEQLKAALIVSIVAGVVCIVAVYWLFYRYQHKIYDQFYDKNEYVAVPGSERKNKAKLQPDSASDKRIEIIGRGYKKLPPPENDKP